MSFTQESSTMNSFEYYLESGIFDPREFLTSTPIPEMDRLRMENEKLKLENEKLRKERDQLALSGVPDEVHILTAIQGDWALHSIHNLEEFCRRWHHTAADYDLLKRGSLHVTLEDHLLYIIQRIGPTIRSRTREDLTSETSETIFVEENKLVVVNMTPDGINECGRIEHAVKNGRLHVAVKMFGVTCTRIFERIGASSRLAQEQIASRDSLLR